MGVKHLDQKCNAALEIVDFHGVVKKDEATEDISLN
jgi:hypothetical protein